MVQRLVQAVLTVLMATVCLAIQSQTSNNPAMPGWPCPIETEITPCVCSQDTLYNLYMDCSLVKTDEQLESIFSSVFPFKDFYELRIIHDPEDMNNKIDEINANTFADLSFERVIITGTNLTEIIDGAFTDSHETLRYLDLSNNYLQAFPFETLALYVVLKTFIIDDNQFPEVFEFESQSIEVFSANRNPGLLLNNTQSPFSGLSNLRELYLSEIGLTHLKTGLFINLTKLEVIDFSRNNLTELEALSVSVPERTLRIINFDQNDIAFVRHDTFLGMMENGTLSMAENKLKTLDEFNWEHIFDQLSNRESIDLRGNSLVCGCDIDWLFMQYEKQYLCRLTDTTLCSTGEQVIFLDVNIYCVRCADTLSECPPPTDCKMPEIF